MVTDKKIAHDIALELLKINAIQLNPESLYTWASGWKSPIYCDNRLILSYPELRLKIKKKLSELAIRKFPQLEYIAGVATAGIPQGVLVADELRKPFIYVRSKPKDHGLTNQIEGSVVKGVKVVVVEDLVSTGGSSLKAVHALKEAGVEVIGMLAIFTYGFQKSVDNFNKEAVDFFSLSDYVSMLEVALKHKYISQAQSEVLKRWREHPELWGKTV